MPPGLEADIGLIPVGFTAMIEKFRNKRGYYFRTRFVNLTCWMDKRRYFIQLKLPFAAYWTVYEGDTKPEYRDLYAWSAFVAVLSVPYMAVVAISLVPFFIGRGLYLVGFAIVAIGYCFMLMWPEAKESFMRGING